MVLSCSRLRESALIQGDRVLSFEARAPILSDPHPLLRGSALILSDPASSPSRLGPHPERPRVLSFEARPTSRATGVLSLRGSALILSDPRPLLRGSGSALAPQDEDAGRRRTLAPQDEDAGETKGARTSGRGRGEAKDARTSGRGRREAKDARTWRRGRRKAKDARSSIYRPGSIQTNIPFYQFRHASRMRTPEAFLRPHPEVRGRSPSLEGKDANEGSTT
jgi:hypothetical protein